MDRHDRCRVLRWRSGGGGACPEEGQRLGRRSGRPQTASLSRECACHHSPRVRAYRAALSVGSGTADLVGLALVTKEIVGRSVPLDDSQTRRSHYSLMRDDLRDELLRMAEEDQAARRGQADTGPVDERNVKRLKVIVVVQGWPGRGLVGDEAPRRLG
jgi:hypothetical protein